MSDPTYVVRPFLPPLDEFQDRLDRIWRSQMLSNNGEQVRELEAGLSESCSGTHVSVVSNGTMALQLALRSLSQRGSVLVPSFTWVATLTAIEYEGFEPILVDVCPQTFNIDPTKIESRLRPDTVAIMPVHVFGQPVDVAAINELAKHYRFSVIYDAAHAFGASYAGKPIMSYGDFSCCSFHATKVFSTAEGGAIYTKSATHAEAVRALRSFGMVGSNYSDDYVGTNAKMSEIHAALGNCNLKHIEKILIDRKNTFFKYKEYLSFENIFFQKINLDETNFSSTAVLFESDIICTKVLDNLNAEGIFPRRYFYPDLSSFDRLKSQYDFCPISQDISSRVLCLPSFYGISDVKIEQICSIIKSTV